MPIQKRARERTRRAKGALGRSGTGWRARQNAGRMERTPPSGWSLCATLRRKARERMAAKAWLRERAAQRERSVGPVGGWDHAWASVRMVPRMTPRTTMVPMRFGSRGSTETATRTGRDLPLTRSEAR
jgi:hypothetical protein